MKIHESLDRDPLSVPLANDGQARLDKQEELEAELATFVCDGQYGRAIERILRSYLTQLDRPRQQAAWVSGFFGSGKSHLLKMLGHLFVDTRFTGGSTARTLVHALPDEIRALLRELDTRIARNGKPPVLAAGSLPSGNEHVRLTVLSILLGAAGLPTDLPRARFWLWLRAEGHLDAVRAAVEAAGRDWFSELGNLFVSKVLAEALLACDPGFARDQAEMRQTLRARFGAPTTDITTEEFLELARDALSADGELPLTILVLDEVQQYIGQSHEKATRITELAEAIQTGLDSRVLLVASGQSALSGSPYLQRLRDRFRITVELTDAEVEAVTRKVLLRKKPSAIEPIRDVLARNAGEISKHLQGSRLAERSEDRTTIVDDYPLLPSRRRFFEHCFRVVDGGGTHSQLRSQLRIVHDALLRVADRRLGALIPADVLYEAVAPDMTTSGLLLNEIATRIARFDDGTPSGSLRRRAASLVFLISRLPREEGVDAGVRADARTIADLLVEDLEADSGPLRSQVEAELEALHADGALMKVQGEYRLQTTEGAEWDRAFRERLAALRNDDAELGVKREHLLAAAVDQVVREIKLLHGESKQPRRSSLHVGLGEPDGAGQEVVIWLRDGWTSDQKNVESDARRRGLEDPVLHLFLPRSSADRLKDRLAEAEAARRVLEHRGAPSTPPGIDAAESMKSRRAAAEAERDEIVREIVASARVFQGGGQELFGDTLADRLEAGAQASLARSYPRFADADHRAWETVMRCARDGTFDALKLVGHDGPVEDHPVLREVVASIGAGQRGTEIRTALGKPPFGWPREAVDAALTVLCRAGALRATQNGQAVGAERLDHAKIPGTVFEPERVRLGMQSKLKLRGLFQSANIDGRADDDAGRATRFVERLLELARQAGGEPPLPKRPSTTKLEDLARSGGPDLLQAILDQHDELAACHDAFAQLARRVAERGPAWLVLERLLGHAGELPIAAEVGAEVEAIRSARSLLDGDDPTGPLRQRLGQALRQALTEAVAEHARAHANGLAQLDGDQVWTGLAAADRDEILRRVGLAASREPSMKSEGELLAALDSASLGDRAQQIAAVPELVARALAEAARRTAPSATRVALRRATLSDAEHVRAWLAEHERMLLDAVAKGPVIVG